MTDQKLNENRIRKPEEKRDELPGESEQVKGILENAVEA